MCPSLCLIKFHSNEIKELPIYLQKFYKRVLEEVIDDQNPLLEKCKFAAIYASNLDEKFGIDATNYFNYLSGHMVKRISSSHRFTF